VLHADLEQRIENGHHEEEAGDAAREQLEHPLRRHARQSRGETLGHGDRGPDRGGKREPTQRLPLLSETHHQLPLPPQNEEEGPDGDGPEHRSNPARTSPQHVAVQSDREERDEEDPGEVALRVHDPRIGARRPVRIEPDREPDAQLVRQQRDGDEVDGDHCEKREEHLADEPHEGTSF
jgi:hypothetical protein